MATCRLWIAGEERGRYEVPIQFRPRAKAEREAAYGRLLRDLEKVDNESAKAIREVIAIEADRPEVVCRPNFWSLR